MKPVFDADEIKFGPGLLMNALLASAAMALILLPCAASAGWIESTLEPSCSDNSRSRVAAGARKQIEYSVRRAEASLRPPVPVGELSCLDGLMDAPIDQFAPTGSLNSIFFRSFDDAVDLPGQAARRICSLAKKSWDDVTRPLETFGFDRNARIPPEYYSRFDLVNFPERSNSESPERIFRRDSSGINGTSEGSSGNLSPAGDAAASTVGDSYSRRELRFDAQAGEYVLPDGSRIDEAGTESTLINEIWKSLYGGEK